jgi:hypothetical protein
MSVYPATTIPPIILSPDDPPQPGCWERFKEGVGWVWSQVVWLVRKVVGVIAWPFQVVSAIAFRVLGVVWPTGAAQAEILWGHVTLWGVRFIASFREDSLKSDIEKLKEKNKGLDNQVFSFKAHTRILHGANKHLQQERNTALEERDDARGEVTNTMIGMDQLVSEKEELTSVNAELQIKVDKAFQERNTALGEKIAALEEKKKKQIELDQTVQRIDVLNNELIQAKNNDELLAQFQKIDEAYALRKGRQEGQPTMTELELQQLIPLYEKQENEYRDMIQERLGELPEEHSIQVPLEGLLKISKEKSGHLKRVSEELHFYAELEKPLNRLKELIQKKQG